MIDPVERPLPNGWYWVRLGDVCETSTGGTPSRGNAGNFGGTIPWVKSGELEDGIILDSEEKITQDGLNNSNARVFPKGTLLIALYGATVGKLGILGIDATTNQAVCAIFPHEDSADSQYLFFFLLGEREKLLKQSYGGAQPNISQSVVRDILCPLPPIAEQERIAAILTEQMAEVDQARAAVEDKLTATEKLPPAYLREIFESDEAKSWTTIRLGDNAQKIGSGITPRGGHTVYRTSGIPLIRSQNVLMNGFEYDGLAFISLDQDAEMEGSRVQRSDVLLNITGASIGRVCVVPDDVCPANVNQHVTIIRVGDTINPKFLSFFISQPRFQKAILESQAGATRQALTKAIIEDFEIPAPSLSHQFYITDSLAEKFSAIENSRGLLQSQLDSIKKLPAAILRRAFNGEL